MITKTFLNRQVARVNVYLKEMGFDKWHIEYDDYKTLYRVVGDSLMGDLYTGTKSELSTFLDGMEVVLSNLVN